MLGGIRIGELDKMISFRTKTETRDTTTGSVGIDYNTEAFRTWGRYLTRPGREIYEADQTVGIRVVELLVRANPSTMGINENMTFVDMSYSPNDSYNIKSIQRNYREGYIIIAAEEKDNSGT